MKVEKISIKNFRLLRNVTLSLDNQTTLIVGRNNSGKTSLTELIRRLLSDKPSFRLEDFSLHTCEEFWGALAIKSKGLETEAVREALPFIEVELCISYEKETANLGALSDFIVDLNPDVTSTIIIIRYELLDGKVDEFFQDAKFDEKLKDDFFQSIKERIPKLYRVNLAAVDPSDPANRKSLEWPRLQALLKSGFINAQRGLDDETYKDKDVLGKILEALFITATSETANLDDQQTAKELEEAVKNMQGGINKGFNEKLKDLVPALTLFGYPGFRDPGLLTETTLDAQRLLTNHTKIRYSGVEGVSLPEAFNGLGARNLIFILLKLLEFFKSYKASPNEPGVHLIFIEEPEAHLHPQMQEVFIRQLQMIVKIFEEKYNEGASWPVQFIVSTHSSHIANEAPFISTRYFLAQLENDGCPVPSTKIKDLSEGLGGVPASDQDFLHQYMTLTRCDMLFADKAILIEGTSERILLPKIIEKFDSTQGENSKLSNQYITVMEVGGSYAHIFYKLLDFLELQALIITDLDTIDSGAGAVCKVSEGVDISNQCIKEWFNVSTITPMELISKAEADKVKSIRRIAYEIPETVGGPCGRSFEDAFMLANPSLFSLDETSNETKEESAWSQAKKKRKKKTEFALEYAINKKEWNVPLYIKEGLSWLAGKSINTITTDKKPKVKAVKVN